MQREMQWQWVKAGASDFGGEPPQARSGHTAVSIGNSKVVFFGGFADKRFLGDVTVYDIENKLWYTPQCTGNGSEGQVGPSPRAFHVSVAIDCNMFIFGGRSGTKRVGDFWMLDTDIWQWSELTSFGDLPSPREFSAASAIANRKIVMYGGWDGKRWLSDVYILDTMSLEWIQLSITGSVPPPRCGHSATMIEKRLLIFGGRGVNGPNLGDLWALKGLNEEDKEVPGWAQLKLPGLSFPPRCGHTVTSGGHFLLLFGGHGTGGWLSRHDVYHNDCIILDRVNVQWKRLPTSNEPPQPRAYHSMTTVGSRFLLFGGFDGKTTFGDLWWLVPEDDPIATKVPSAPSFSKPEVVPGGPQQDDDMTKDGESEDNSLAALAKRLGITTPSITNVNLVNEADDKELIDLLSKFSTESFMTSGELSQNIQAVRDHWTRLSPRAIPLKELGPLLRDYQRLILRRSLQHSSSHLVSAWPMANEVGRFFHLKSASQLRMDDIPKLMDEYRRLVSA